MSSTSRKPEVVVITGASAGVGRARAREFAKSGASIGLLARGEAGLDAARAEIEAAGGTALVLPTDVADSSEGLAPRLLPAQTTATNTTEVTTCGT